MSQVGFSKVQTAAIVTCCLCFAPSGKKAWYLLISGFVSGFAFFSQLNKADYSYRIPATFFASLNKNGSFVFGMLLYTNHCKVYVNEWLPIYS